MDEYIKREAALEECDWYAKEFCECKYAIMPLKVALENPPAANVLPRDEAIKMGAELAAMHGSDATSQQLEEAYLKGVEDGMTRRDVRPVVRGKWKRIEDDFGKYDRCSNCGKEYFFGPIVTMHFCPNCGADMREES